jgi:hypothetical protein
MTVPLYAAIAGAENCAHRILDNTDEMIRSQGNDEKVLEMVNKNLLLMNIAMGALLALRETLGQVLPEDETVFEVKE